MPVGGHRIGRTEVLPGNSLMAVRSISQTTKMLATEIERNLAA
jgi:hypothetical protein